MWTLSLIHIFNWLGDERFALGCIILILLTTSVGQPIVLYVSALGNVDPVSYTHLDVYKRQT